MRPDLTTKVLLCVIAVLLGMIAFRPDPTPAAGWTGKALEYKVVNQKIENPEALEADLDRLGAEGWRLISIGFGPMIFFR